MSILKKIMMEPPLRLLFKALYGVLPVSASTRSLWDVSARPNYLAGVLLAAQQARSEGLKEISVIEFGVAGGNGLVVLQAEAEAVERETGVSIRVFGFDNGPAGLPSFIGDHRDHPDEWQPGDFPMDEPLCSPGSGAARARPRERLGDRSCVLRRPGVPPVGFVAFDLDLYSSTIHALRLLTLPASGRSTTSPSTSTTPNCPSATASRASCSRSTTSTRRAPRQDRSAARLQRRPAVPREGLPQHDVRRARSGGDLEVRRALGRSQAVDDAHAALTGRASARRPAPTTTF